MVSITQHIYGRCYLDYLAFALWFVVGSNQMNMNFLWFTLTALALSFLLTVIYLFTNSIFLCIIFHAFINSLWDVFIPVTNVASGLWTFLLAFLLFAIFETYQKKEISHSKIIEILTLIP